MSWVYYKIDQRWRHSVVENIIPILAAFATTMNSFIRKQYFRL